MDQYTPFRTHHSLHIVREDETAYDARPSVSTPPKRSKHKTMIEDAVVDAVERLGLVAAGLYLHLERHAGKDGRWRTNMNTIALCFDCPKNHVQRAAKLLEDAGFITRTDVKTERGLTTGVEFFLPNHAIPTPMTHPNTHPSDDPNTCARSTYLVDTKVDTSKSSTNSLARTAYSDDFEKFWKLYPKGHGVKSDSFSEWKKLTSEDRDDALHGIDDWRASRRWRDGYVVDCQRWLKRRAWENPPPENDQVSNGKTNRRVATSQDFLDLAASYGDN